MRALLISKKPDHYQRNPTMSSLIRQASYLAFRWKILLAPVFITAGVAVAINWVSASPEVSAPRETPSITLSDLDADGDLEIVVPGKEGTQILWNKGK